MPAHHPQEWQLSALLDDELADGEARVVTLHVGSCTGCAEKLDRLRDARSALRALPGLAVPAQVLQDMAETSAAAERRRRRSMRRAALVATSALGLGVGLWVLGAEAEPVAPRGQVQPPVERFVAEHTDLGDVTVVPVRNAP